MNDHELLIPTVSEICKAIDGDESTSPLALMIQAGIELGNTLVNLLRQEPAFYCPTGRHDTDYAISLSGSKKIPSNTICPTHLGTILRRNPTWPPEQIVEKVIYAKVREEKV